MKKERGKLTQLMTLLVFAVFALCVMWLLLTGTQVYQRLTETGEESYRARVTGQYLATRVRQSQGAALKELKGVPALALEETIEGECYVTWVYLYEGHLRELFSIPEGSPDPEDGEKILPLNTLEMSMEKDLLTICTEYGTRYLHIPCGREVTS